MNQKVAIMVQAMVEVVVAMAVAGMADVVLVAVFGVVVVYNGPQREELFRALYRVSLKL